MNMVKILVTTRNENLSEWENVSNILIKTATPLVKSTLVIPNLYRTKSGYTCQLYILCVAVALLCFEPSFCQAWCLTVYKLWLLSDTLSQCRAFSQFECQLFSVRVFYIQPCSLELICIFIDKDFYFSNYVSSQPLGPNSASHETLCASNRTSFCSLCHNNLLT